MSNRTLNLDDRVYRYLLDHSLREDPTQRRLREVTAQLEQGGMQISPEQGQFMTLLVERLATDNTLWGGAVADSDRQDPDTVALRELNDRLHTDERVSISLLPLGDGLTLVGKRP